jgi:TonB family protein
MLLACLPLSAIAESPDAPQSSGSATSDVVEFNPRANITRPVANGSHNVQNFYPEEARRLGQQGTVIVSLIIRTDGSVTDVAVAKSCGMPLLDAAAVAAVATWRYFPATQNGVPINLRYQVAIQFKFRDDTIRPPTAPYNVVDAPADAYPSDALSAKQQGTTELGLLIDEGGHIINTQVLASSGVESLDTAAKKLAERWHFNAATLDGKPQRYVLEIIINWRLPITASQP